MAIDFIKDTKSKSASTQSRRCITVSVDDSNLPRDAETIAYCSNYYSKKHNTAIWCQNVLGITLKCGDRVIPLDMRLVSKQGRGNTDKLTLVITMLKEVLVHGKNNFVMTIGETKAKLSAHKKNIELHEDQWGCDKPVYRAKAISPTFGECIVIFFRDRGKIRTLLVFRKPLRTSEAMRIWSQHHGIEQFWRYFKSNLRVSAMSLQSREGAYVSLGEPKSYQLPHLAPNQYLRTTHISSDTTSTHRRKTDTYGLHNAFSYNNTKRTLIITPLQ